MAEQSEPPDQLSSRLPRYVAVVAADCQRKGERLLHDVLQSSAFSVEEVADDDAWRSGTYQFAVHLTVRSEAYMRIGLDDIPDMETTIRDRLRKVMRARDEQISYVTIEPNDEPVTGQAAPLPSRDQDADLWGDADSLRLFISHRAEDRQLAAGLKAACSGYGISCFVAHEDIVPTAEWLSEIERALRSMDALLALLTPEFPDSNWTDQELGVAVGRGVPVVPVRLGRDPYGFIGRYQGISGLGRTAPDLSQEILTTLLRRMESTRGRMTEALVVRFERAESYEHAKTLVRVLSSLDALSQDQITRLELAFGSNSQVADCWAVQETLPGLIRRFRAGLAGQAAGGRT